MAEKEVRKTTAKRAPRRTTTKVVSSRTAVRKTAATSSSVRKAPARTVVSAPRKKAPSKATFIFVFFFIVVVAGSVAIGYSDKGPIDVTNAIATRKQNATPEEQEAFKSVPVQQGQNNVVNGGLVGTGKKEPVAVRADTGTSTETLATSTEEMSTSTDAAGNAEDAPAEEAVIEEEMETEQEVLQ